MGIKISEMAADSSIGGGELIPVSDAGTSKSVTTAGIKQYVIDGIEAIAAGTAVTGADGVFILQGGVLKPVDIDLIAQHAIDTVWAKTAETVVDAADIIALKDGGATEKTVTAAILATYIKTAIEAAILDVSDLTAATSISAADMFLLTVGTTGKKVTFTTLNDAIYASLNTYVAALSAVTPADADVLYMVQGGVAKKVTIAAIKAMTGSTVAPATTIENKVPQWASAQKTLKDGLTVQTTVRATATAVDTALPTEKAVRTLITGIESTIINTVGELWIPATSITPNVTGGCGVETYELAGGANYRALLFDPSSNETAQFSVVMPPAWDRGPIKAKVFWAPGTGTANAADYLAFLMCATSLPNGGTMDISWGTDTLIVDTVIESAKVHITPASGAMTVAGTILLGDLIHFRLIRYTGYSGTGDALAVDARVLGVLIQYNNSNAVVAW